MVKVKLRHHLRGREGDRLSFAETILPHAVHVGALLYMVCFLFRDQLYLRLFAVLGDIVYTLFYYGTVADPFWAMLYSTINMAINIVMMGLILRDRQMTPLSDDEMSLFQNLRGLNPGQFRRLMKMGNWNKVQNETTLTEEGKDLDRLHYVLTGDVEVDKSGRKIKVDPAVFIGELAYLRKKPATATVRVKPGAVVVSWAHKDLERVTAKDDGLAAVLGTLLSNDLAEKVARG
jgi:RNAse (barnase) inhibitor barstar